MLLSSLIQHHLVQRSNVFKTTAVCMLYMKKKQFKRIKKKPSNRIGCPNRPRTRKSVRSVFNELGRKRFRRAYRMHLETFYLLYKKLRQSLWIACNYNPSCSRKFPHIPNGRVHPTVRLACSLRLFAGGEAVDLATTFSVSPTVVFDSLNIVMDAVNSHPEMKIEFPKSHMEQIKIAQGFKIFSKADIDCCVGCIDGMLVWMLKPTEKVCEEAQVGSGKFFAEESIDLA